jgi:hypothetical protein
LKIGIGFGGCGDVSEFPDHISIEGNAVPVNQGYIIHSFYQIHFGWIDRKFRRGERGCPGWHIIDDTAVSAFTVAAGSYDHSGSHHQKEKHRNREDSILTQVDHSNE